MRLYKMNSVIMPPCPTNMSIRKNENNKEIAIIKCRFLYKNYIMYFPTTFQFYF